MENIQMDHRTQDTLERLCSGKVPKAVLDAYWRLKKFGDKIDCGVFPANILALLVAITHQPDEAEKTAEKNEGEFKRDAPVLIKWNGKEVPGVILKPPKGDAVEVRILGDTATKRIIPLADVRINND